MIQESHHNSQLKWVPEKGVDQQKKVVFVKMENQSGFRSIRLLEQQCKNLNRLKKKILNLYDYEQSQGKKIKLSIMQAYPNQPTDISIPIFSDQNLKIVMRLLLTFERAIKVRVGYNLEEGVLQKKQMLSKQAIEKGQIHFDQNGSLIEENDEMIENIPEDDKFDNSLGHVRCEFCQKNNQDIQYLKRCGGLYGPFGEQHYVHLLCALWCHQVFLGEDGYLKKVETEIKRSMRIKCSFCLQKGAGLICVGKRQTKKGNYRSCDKKYHFKCAFDSGCEMNWVSYKMLCPGCKVEAYNAGLMEINMGSEGEQSEVGDVIVWANILSEVKRQNE